MENLQLNYNNININAINLALKPTLINAFDKYDCVY